MGVARDFAARFPWRKRSSHGRALAQFSQPSTAMPATAGKVRMPAGNRQSTSSSLNTHSIWQNAIGYDPYAAAAPSDASAGASAEAAKTQYENMKGLLQLAKMSQASRGEPEEEGPGRGGWKGKGQLRGGWAAGKDLGFVEPEEPAGGAAAAMPDSTDSDSDGSDSDSDAAGPSAGAAAAAAVAPDLGDKRKRERERDEPRKSSKKHKKEKKQKKEKHKSKKHKKEKHKHKKKKHRGSSD